VTVARRSLSPRALVGAAFGIVALSCGEVPTFPDGIAYISAVLLPAPAVALGDTLRDSLGVATPIRVVAIGVNGDTIPGITATFVVTTVPGKSLSVGETGYVVGDSVRSAQVVARVGDRLQTPPALLEVVRQPDSLAPTSATTMTRIGEIATGEVFATSSPLAVLVSTGATATRSPVRGIIVRYAITKIFPESAPIPDTTVVLIDDANRFIGATGRSGADTTDVSGNASRRVRAVPFGFDSVEIRASANDLKGVPLRGSPIRFVVTTK